MKGLSILFAMALLVAAQLLAVQLRRAHALPVAHQSHPHVTQTASVSRSLRPPALAETNSLD